jgi:hypothetical protein
MVAIVQPDKLSEAVLGALESIVWIAGGWTGIANAMEYKTRDK